MNDLILYIMAITISNSLTVKSPVFTNNTMIPEKYTCMGANINPAITITGIPKETKSLALIMEDPDAPYGNFDHWIMWNIPLTGRIEENSTPGRVGINGKKENKYTGPCPPSGTHHYHFKIYALNTMLNLANDTDKKTLLDAMNGHIISQGELIGLYEKTLETTQIK